ncbi:MAG: GNAT family N-acetyltransferase [Pseudolabrys sp.]
MSAHAAYTISQWTSAERHDDIMAMVHAAFGEFQPPSSVLNETAADLAARQRDSVVLVAQTGGEFIGSVFCAPKGDALYLTRLAAAPRWRKAGVGGALLQAAEAQARELGAKRLTIRVRVTLPGNLAYFKRAGFIETGTGQDPGRTPYITMERVLGVSPPRAAQ